MAFSPCAVIPTYDNPDTVREVVELVREHVPVILVDDGSDAPGRAVVEAIGAEGLAQVHHRSQNGGKGAGVTTGFELARAAGYSHALQVDADGQHALEDIPAFLDAARAQPEALILGAPVYDDSAPTGRLVGRQITRFWTNIETYGRVIDDPMCGFRVYPVEAACALAPRCGQRMDFDIEIAVRLVWAGLPVVNLPTKVRYHADGVSHFHLVRDNLRISWMHSKLVLSSWLRLLTGR
ncbi:Undecaprenyl-phosphate mannosyltransferase [Enhygromyxa salina]|uniref:Undecaprenyl-phosphate mannosyltransferase n=1 Tax=Enhygromyxa salina TaxID=215803 RepID=A0A2S9YF81_9BACT|nr:glycosyltransferase family 2 protein [Enhygromyxa salina]PRQ03692.1 Undecaprenyl-phosphate mannosyltransferase [Enhygromyxa salina]